MPDGPLLLLSFTMWAYWLGVLIMAAAQRIGGHRKAGLLPSDPTERAMWLLWVPVIAAWITLPAFAWTREHWLLALPELAREATLIVVLRWIAAVAGVFALLLTILCWVSMGRSWSVAIVPDEKRELVTEGMFQYVRHPIYALSVLLMMCTLIVLPTLPVLVIALTHITLMHIKAAREERFLLSMHGEEYERYRARTGRFLPRLAAQRSEGSEQRTAEQDRKG